MSTSEVSAFGPSSSAAPGPRRPSRVPVALLLNTTLTYEVCLVALIPDMTPVRVQIELDFPAAVEEAAEHLQWALDVRVSSRFAFVVPVFPQPEVAFGCFIARPLWAADRVQILVDSRAWDGRIFSIMVDRWVQWASFMLQGGFAATGTPNVYVRDAPAPPGRALVFADGDLVVLLPSQMVLPVLRSLPHMLMRAHLWAEGLPDLLAPDTSSLYVLTDAMPKLMRIDRTVVRSAEDLRHFLAPVL